jgi:hypothetical protein
MYRRSSNYSAGGVACLTSSRSSFGGDVEMAQDEVSAQSSNKSKSTRPLTYIARIDLLRPNG